MVKIGLQIKANLENVTDLQPDGEDFRWYLRPLRWGIALKAAAILLAKIFMACWTR